MNAITFSDSVLNLFKKHFPNGYARSSKYTLGNGIHFSFGLIGDTSDCSSGIRQNDILNLSFGIHENFIFNSTHEIENKIIIESNQSSYAIKPQQQYFAMSRVKIPFRKINNTPEKALVNIEKYFIKAKELIKEDIKNNNIYNQHTINQKYLDL